MGMFLGAYANNLPSLILVQITRTKSLYSLFQPIYNLD